ncbi:lipocalin-like domain-containing protein [Sphingobacterium wenxiniae]|uniref:Lipocalin-like domain-containing protein n=1 Tax=Sphingobacterium wenxiniae TaxID=683125 RepID=A0A1I6QB42_9SPHI|nr:lipocalin-like domain-containing protein [Sphingobacterium wenxiniae]SFS49687.1 Lipocalin-like domain-containing protein [Sphingobacterium wenxiniae]
MTSLKNELIGSWKLLSYIEVPIQGEDSLFPMGKNPYGILLYSADGYMSVQIAKEERLLFGSNDKLIATGEEMASALEGYIAFAGRFKVDNSNAIVSYMIKSSLFPNWKNKVQHRKVDFEGENILYLKSTEPILSNGLLVNSYMTWQRMDRTIDDFFEEQILEERMYDS